MPARNKVPRNLRDTSLWPVPDEATLRSTNYVKRRQAVEMYCGGDSYAEIFAQTRIKERTVRWLVDRCTDIDLTTGTIFGFHACKEGFRARPYTRKTPPTTRKGRGGRSGSLGLLFRAFPKIEEMLISEVFREKKEKQQFNISTTDLVAIFHEELKRTFAEQGLDWEKQWPFTERKQGYEAVRKWRKGLRDRYPIKYVASHFGTDAAKKLEAGANHPSLFENFRALSHRQLDFHQVDFTGLLVFRDPNGVEFRRAVDRFYLGAIVTEYPVTVVGYILVFAESPNSDDVVDMVQCSIFPEPREGPVSTLLPNGKVVLAGLIEELYGSGFSVLSMDNASYNIACSAIGPIMDAVGCMVQLGAPGKWWSRPLIELFFSILERKTGRTLAITFGKGPGDPMRADAVEGAQTLEIYVDDLLQTFEELIELVNSRTVSMATYGQTAVAAVRGMFENKPLGIFPQPLPATPTEPGWTFFANVIECNVCGNEKGTRCYINLDGRQYTNPNLRLRLKLIRKPLVVCRHRWNDNLVVAVVKETNEYLGYMLPNRRARRHPMHPRLLKICNAHFSDAYYKSIEKSPGRKLLERKLEQARKDPRRKVSKSALDILRAVQYAEQTAKVASLPIPESSGMNPAENDMAADQLQMESRALLTDDDRTKIKIPFLNRMRRNGRR